MGISKTKEFSKSENQLALYAKAISHPARIAILSFLAQQENCVCGDIVTKIPLAQSTISQHLKELKKIGLIKGTISGSNICYCINRTEWHRAHESLSCFFDKNIKSLDQCCDN